LAKDEVNTHVFSPAYLNIFFQHRPDVAGRFYYSLSGDLGKRILERADSKREAESTPEKKSVPPKLVGTI